MLLISTVPRVLPCVSASHVSTSVVDVRRWLEALGPRVRKEGQADGILRRTESSGGRNPLTEAQRLSPANNGWTAQRTRQRSLTKPGICSILAQASGSGLTTPGDPGPWHRRTEKGFPF